MPNFQYHRNLVLLALFLALALTGAVYWSGLSGGFFFDDSINIIENPKVLINHFSWNELRQAATSFGGGGLDRPISMLTLGVNHALTGLDPFYFKLTNLAIHLFNGIGLWLLTNLLLTAYRIRYHPELTDDEIAWLSIAVAAVWLLHPFNLTSVLYIVQRMTSLAALFMICGLILYTSGRLRQLRGQRGAALIIIGVAVFGALATLSKENGILLPLLVFITEWLIFGFQAPDQSTRRFVIACNIVIAIIPGILALGFLIIRSDWVLASYNNRDFTLSERLLTEGRVLWFYLQMILLPDPTRMGLYHDDILLSKGWFDPITTLPAIVGLIMTLLGAIVLRRRVPLLAFGMLFFFAGHLLESTILSLEIAHEHRNYLPAYGLLLPLIYYLGHRRLRERFSLNLQAAFLAGLIIALGASTAVRASYWANDMDMALVEARHHPNSPRTNLQAARIFFNLAVYGVEPEFHFQQARQYLEAARRLDDHNLTSSFNLLILDDRQQRPVNSELLNDLANKLVNLPLSSASINALLRLSHCQNEGFCKLAPEVFDHLFQAILQNPTLVGKSRAQVLTEVAQLAISQNALDIALYLTYEALRLTPADPQIYLNNAQILIALGAYEAAQQKIDKARQLDIDKFYDKKIQIQEHLLEKVKNAKPKTDRDQPNYGPAFNLDIPVVAH